MTQHWRCLYVCLALAILLTATTTGQAVSAPLALNLRGTMALAGTTVDQNNQPLGISGLSGITYLGGNTYAAVMDNSNKLIFLTIELDGDGAILSSQVTGGLTLADTRDFEGIAYTGAQRNSVLLADEGTPSVREYSLADGTLMQLPAVPDVFQNIASDRGLESLALNSVMSELWTANEEALTVDGFLATETSGTTVRLLRYEVTGNTYTPAGQFAYEVQPIHGIPLRGSSSGLVEIVAIPGGELLALERSAALSSQGIFKNSIFAIDSAGATDVSTFTGGLIGETFTPVTKTELWSGAVVPAGMNMEGLTLGPALGNGRWAMIGIVDDGDMLSSNTVVSFELVLAPEPSSMTLALLALVGLPFVVRLRKGKLLA